MKNVRKILIRNTKTGVTTFTTYDKVSMEGRTTWKIDLDWRVPLAKCLTTKRGPYDIILTFPDKSYLYFEKVMIKDKEHMQNSGTIRFCEKKVNYGSNFSLTMYL